MARRDRSQSGESSPWARPGFIGAALVVVVAVACGVYALTARGGHRNAGVPGRTTTPSTAITPTTEQTQQVVKAKAATKGRGGCDLPPGPQTVPTTAPSEITWTLWRTAALPSSPTAGPMVVQGDLARCYAHSPLGALIAAVQIYARWQLVMSNQEWRSIAYGQMVPSAGRQIVIADMKAEAKADPAGLAAPTPPGDFAQIAAFQFLSYTPDSTVIDIVVTKAGQYVVGPITLAWSDGDWKIAVLPAGTITGPAQVISSTAGYIAWSGV